MDRKMKARIRKAIVGSIQKWEKICWHKGTDKKTENCPLCIEFNMCGNIDNYDCPVQEITDGKDCTETPYHDWIEHQVKKHHSALEYISKIKCQECKTLAKLELDFLRNVLKKFDAGEIYKD